MRGCTLRRCAGARCAGAGCEVRGCTVRRCTVRGCEGAILAVVSASEVPLQACGRTRRAARQGRQSVEVVRGEITSVDSVLKVILHFHQ